MEEGARSGNPRSDASRWRLRAPRAETRAPGKSHALCCFTFLRLFTYSTYQDSEYSTVIPIDARIDCGSRCARALGPMRLRGSAKRIDALVRDLGDSDLNVQQAALDALGAMQPAALAPHADAIVSKLEDSDPHVRVAALFALQVMEPAVLAQHVDIVVPRLEDSDDRVSDSALLYLDGVEPATLARHAGAVLSKLHSEQATTRCLALVVLCNLEPAELVKHAHALLSMLDDHEVITAAFVGFLNKMGLNTVDVGDSVRNVAICTLWGLPAFVTRDDGFHRDWNDPAPGNLRSRLLGRLAWYRCRLRMRVSRIALYWYALPYRPSGPGHARDVAAWDQMNKRSRLV